MSETIKLAERDHEIAYTRKSRAEIESAAGKGLWPCLSSGIERDQAAIIWAGLRGAGAKKLRLDDVVEMLQESEEYDRALRTCIRELLRVRPFGKKIEDRDIEALVGPGEDEEGGKDEPAGAVPASE